MPGAGPANWDNCDTWKEADAWRVRSELGRGRGFRREGLWDDRRVGLDWQTICLLTHLEHGT